MADAKKLLERKIKTLTTENVKLANKELKIVIRTTKQVDKIGWKQMDEIVGDLIGYHSKLVVNKEIIEALKDILLRI